MRPRCILFDLDNTLVDRHRSISRIAERIAEDFATELGEISLEAIATTIQRADHAGYRPREEAFAEILSAIPWRNRPGIERFEHYWTSVFPHCAQPMKGLYSTLDALLSKGIRMGIITNGRGTSQNGKIDTLGIRRYMETIIVSESVNVEKPDRRIYQLALMEMKIAPAEAWFVGDNPTNDVVGAAAAGLTSVWLRGTTAWPEGEEEPKLQIDSLEELVPLIED